MSELVKTEVADGVMVIAINRPEVRNAVDLSTTEAMAAAFDELDARDDVTVGILTGSGGFFCAGMDLKAFARGERPVIKGRGFGGLTEAPPQKPLIAAVEGVALGGGFELALACDLIVAASDSKFGLPEVKRGLIAAGGGVLRLPRRLPYHRAMELILTGAAFDAAQAQTWGLVSRVSAPGSALTQARELAGEIAANGPLAIRASKYLVTQSDEWTLKESFPNQRDIVGQLMSSDDAKEGAKAFAEKRAPVWTGR
ncbi:crotonase/enoyl-CoA hydratase family protein [Mycobacterium kyogaense]|uniref:crotonase/enoyl-CoA hydratase family protein n=1 Tax=Mycobacterium kyogaense TaxID=2212479 RepID=UPI000DAD36DF|nr:crotonase/enoyl-CoA hydratase family protein [Mycobacterium kyogaense]